MRSRAADDSFSSNVGDVNSRRSSSPSSIPSGTRPGDADDGSALQIFTNNRAAELTTRRRSPQGDAEWTTKEQVLGFKPARDLGTFSKDKGFLP